MQMVIISAELATDNKLKTNTVCIYNSCAGFGVFQALGAGYVVAEPTEEFSVSILLHCM